MSQLELERTGTLAGDHEMLMDLATGAFGLGGPRQALADMVRKESPST